MTKTWTVSDIALDHVSITTNDNDPNISLVMYGHNSSVLLVDSYIMYDYDILYYGDWCDILKNNRVSSDEQYISSLLIICSAFTTSSYPVILSLENHCSEEQQVLQCSFFPSYSKCNE